MERQELLLRHSLKSGLNLLLGLFNGIGEGGLESLMADLRAVDKIHCGFKP